MSLLAAAFISHPKDMAIKGKPDKKLAPFSEAISTVKSMLAKKNIQTLIVFSSQLLGPRDPYSPTPDEPSAYYALGLDKILAGTPHLAAQLPTTILENDLEFIDLLKERIKPFGIQLNISPNIKMDEQSSLALSLLDLTKKPLTKVVSISLPYKGLKELFEFGRLLGAVAEASKTNIAILATGNLSSRLAKDSPAGFDKAGKDFDELVQRAAKQSDFSELIDLPAEKIEAAGEGASRPLAVVAGSSDKKFKSKLEAYSAPTGTGYAAITWS